MAYGLCLNKKRFARDILENDFDGNQSECAKELGISAGYLSSVLGAKRNGGRRLFGSIIMYCARTHREPFNYIIAAGREEEQP